MSPTTHETAPEPYNAENRRGRNAILYSEGQDLSRKPQTLRSFLRLLNQRYREALLLSLERDLEIRSSYPALIESLDLAEALFKRHDQGLRAKDTPISVGLFGPTQVGKSTVLNWIVDREAAVPSPLAGFTVHPQGFSDTSLSPWCEKLDRYFAPMIRMRREALSPTDLQGYSLEMSAPSAVPDFLRGKILWDTPDFDSTQADRYRDSVYKTLALVDLLIVVLSKDKYGDLTVWNFLKLVEPLRQPTLVIINKTDPSTDLELKASLQKKWQQFRKDPCPFILTLPYLTQTERETSSPIFHEKIKHPLIDCLVQADPSRKMDEAFIGENWEAWIEPVQAEYRLSGVWQQRIQEVLTECLERYRRDYLDHPHHYETFQRALGELLSLLEVPGIGTALHAARRLVTWPIRQLGRMGDAASGRDRSSESLELTALNQTARHALLRLTEELLLERTETTREARWWGGVNQALNRDKDALLVSFDHAARQYVQSFKPEIEKTAHSLYLHLQKHPVVLNSLRATRMTTDAAALGVALHTGGIGVQDFVIAPAVLSLTSLLTESALGHFMSRAQEQLKQKQIKAVDSLLMASLSRPLQDLAELIDPRLRLGIPLQDLEDAQKERRGGN